MASEHRSIGAPILVHSDGSGRSLERVEVHARGSGAFDEAWLQRLIDECPSCLPISEIEPGLEPFLSICREMPTPHGPIDNLLMTRSGDVAIVEAKLFRNPEARRKVLAQALDYAVSIFGMDYATFEKSVLSGTFRRGNRPKSLFDALQGPEQPREEVFVDAVVRNLRKGRAIVLIAGDGIRSEAELLVNGLHHYAQFHFTLALVELAVYRMPDGGQLLVRPRTLAKTETVRRYVFEAAGTTPQLAYPEKPESLSSEQYWEALEKAIPGARRPLEDLIEAVEPFGVYAEFLGSLNFKWERPAGLKPLNLGYIRKNGAVWTDAAAWFVPRDLAKAYVEDLATRWDCVATARPGEASWTPTRRGKPIRLSDDGILSHLQNWIPAMQSFINEVAKHDSQ